MTNKTYPWILIDKANMAKIQHRFHNAESVAYAMMKSGTIQYRNFNEFVVIKNESVIVNLADLMEGIGGDYVAVHSKVKEILENA
jgi:hypothetical protein